MQLIKNLPILISGIIIGIIIYQSLMIAPSINKLLSNSDASLYLRYIWPKFFVVIGLLSLLSIFILSFFNSQQNIPKVLSILSFILMLICYLIIPYMNDAKDSLRESTFVILHMLSILMTIVTLIMNILIFIFWKY
tara:strand:+ start:806 stop:1213 length:408 start_codon:yes stop_codon:yes gene_type:complete